MNWTPSGGCCAEHVTASDLRSSFDISNGVSTLTTTLRSVVRLEFETGT